MEIQVSDTTTIRIANIAKLCAQNLQAAQLRSRVLINAPNNCIMRGHALEISDSKLVVSIPSSLNPGDACAAFITITIDDETFGIVGAAQVISCTGYESERYRADMHFVVEDEQSRLAIQKLFGADAADAVQ